ncbi:hypothetical protein BJV74DRAFT_358601 [Russula compacta]|nr:hypothetical protein BJV74DRAFT_358601 [Russula compacta]
MPSPTNPVSPPSYQMSLEEEFNQKSSRTILLSSSTTYEVDEEGWPIYDPAAFEAVTESNEERSPPASSSAGFLGGDTSGHERQSRPPYLKVLPSTRPMKSKSSERRRRNPESDHDFSSEPRVVTPPPPFTATGPSLDGPPFEDVVRLSYDRPDSQAASPIEPSYPPLTRSPPPSQSLQPVEPLRLPPHRLTSSNFHPSHRFSPIPPNTPPRPNLATITRVEFDPQMAYSQYGGRTGNHTSMQVGATAFYK